MKVARELPVEIRATAHLSLNEALRLVAPKPSANQSELISPIVIDGDKVETKPATVAELDAQVESILKGLPATVRKGAEREINKIYGVMKRELLTTIAKIEKRTDEQLQSERAALEEQRAHLNAREQEVRASHEKAGKMLAGITPIMTQEDFKMIRSLLHPDRHPEDAEKYNKAFTIFNRLLETINPNIPIAVKRKSGWANAPNAH